jgi:hypothetical protein
MSVIGDKIRTWCQEESAALELRQDNSTGLEFSIAPSGGYEIRASVRASGPDPDRVVITHAFELPVPPAMQQSKGWHDQLPALLESVAVNRPGLISCRLIEGTGPSAAEVAVTVHADGLTKQSFLTALEEAGKVRRVIEWGIEGVTASDEVLSNVSSVVEQAEALASEVSDVGKGVPTPAQSESAPTVIARPEEMEAPVSAATGPETQSKRFCPNCGKEAKEPQRFCVGCGASLGGDA